MCGPLLWMKCMEDVTAALKGYMCCAPRAFIIQTVAACGESDSASDAAILTLPGNVQACRAQHLCRQEHSTAIRARAAQPPQSACRTRFK